MNEEIPETTEPNGEEIALNYLKHTYRNYVLDYFDEKGIEINALADKVLEMQSKHLPNLTKLDARVAIDAVLDSEEILFHVMTAIQLDKLATANQLDEPLSSLVKADEGVYTVDETIALGIVHSYGAIAETTYGYLDVAKHDIARDLDETQKNTSGRVVNTFIDDVVSAIIACGVAWTAQNQDRWGNYYGK